MAEMTAEIRSELLALTIGMFNAVPGEKYLNQMAAAWSAGASMSTIANSLSKTVQFGQVYPLVETAPEFAARLVAILLGNEVAADSEAWATGWIISQLSGGMTRGAVILTAVQALRATTNTAYANAKLALANKVEVAEYYSVTKRLSDTDLSDLQAVIAGVTSSVATVGAAKVKLDSFEILALGTSASGAYSAAGFKSVKHGVVAGDVEFTAVAAGTTLTITASPTKNTTYTLADSSGTADALGLILAGEAVIATGTVTATGVETIAITSDDTAVIPIGITHTVDFDGNTNNTITVAGDAGLIVTAGTGITGLDASGLTKVGVNYVSDALTAAATLTGSAFDDFINASASTKSVIVNAGAGNDTITTGSSNDVINGGDGDDKLTSGTGLDTVNVGSGNDTFVVTANAFGNIYSSINGMGIGDKIDFLAGGGAATFTKGAIILAPTAAFSDFLHAAAAGGADRVVWFYYLGDTYLVQDVSASSAFSNGADQVVKLTGLVDLSTATIDGGATNILTIA